MARVLGGSRRRTPRAAWRRRTSFRHRTSSGSRPAWSPMPPYSAPAATTMVALLQQRHQRHRLGRHAAGRRPRRARLLQRDHAFLQRRHRRAGQPRVGVAEAVCRLKSDAAWSALSNTRSWWSGDRQPARRRRHRESGRRGGRLGLELRIQRRLPPAERGSTAAGVPRSPGCSPPPSS